MRELLRTRWAAIGAAVAVSLGAGGIGLTQAAINSGSKPVFVAITPCRLMDTRPGSFNVGDKSSPFGPGETVTLTVTGSTGRCTGIPTDATGAALNVTAVDSTQRSFLTVHPADTDRPLASNLNWGAAEPSARPNKVDIKLSPTGQIKLYNYTGTVQIIVDLVGYYIDHTHDDRYYTETEVNGLVAALNARVDALESFTADLDAERSLVWTSRNNGMSIGASVESVVSVTVTAPAAGNITVISTTTVREDTAGEYVGCSISDSAAFNTNYIQRWQSPGASGQDSQLSGVRAFAISAGQTATYQLVCYNLSSGTSSVYDPTMVAIFTPAP